MEFVTGYFISRAPAIEAYRFLKKQGFKIDVLGYENQEDFREKSGINQLDDNDVPFYGFIGANAGMTSGYNAFMFTGSGPVFAATPIISLFNRDTGGDFRHIMSEYGVPEDIEHEIKSVVSSGSSVVVVECDEKDTDFVSRTLKNHGAQNIHA